MRSPPLGPGDALGNDFRVVGRIRRTQRRILYEVDDVRPDRRTRTCWSCRFTGTYRADSQCSLCGEPLVNRRFIASLRWGASCLDWERFADLRLEHPGLAPPLAVFVHDELLVSVTGWGRLLLDEPAPLPAQAVLDAGVTLGEALRFLAANRVRVTSLGPDNVLLHDDGFPRWFDLDLGVESAAAVASLSLTLRGWLPSHDPEALGRLHAACSGENGHDPTLPDPDAAAISDTGLVRSGNEDAWTLGPIPEGATLYAVADGLGGHADGEVASRVAVTTLLSALQAGPPEGPLAARLETAFAAAEAAVRRERDDSVWPLGTTLVAAVVQGREAVIAHIGDSRAYICRSGILTRLTDDHTVVQELVRTGRLAPEDAAGHHLSNVLKRVVGLQEPVRPPDLLVIGLQPGDRLLLCTDGVWGEIDPDLLEVTVARGETASNTCRDLASAALQAGAPDNFTAIVVHVPE